MAGMKKEAEKETEAFWFTWKKEAEKETEAFWFTWSNGDTSSVYVEYPKDLKDKPDEIAKFLEKEWFRYPCKVTYRGIHKPEGLITLPGLREFFVDLKDGKTQ